MKRRLCLAFAFVGSSKVLVLDEPTSGLDTETRTLIWDVVAGFRGQRTVIITTHDMEEADVLGDRIAIMDQGRVVCYGTTMFLKTIYGTGYNIHVLKNPKAPANYIIDSVKSKITLSRVKVVSSSQVDFIVTESHMENFPRLFEALERNGSSLGINGISVTHTTMEDVFLNVASTCEEDDGKNAEKLRIIEIMSRDANYVFIESWELYVQQFKALVWRRMVTIRRNILSLLIRIIVTSLLLYIMNHYLLSDETDETESSLKLNLELYKDTITPIVYDGNNERIADIASDFVKQSGGEVELFPNETDFTKYLMKMIEEDERKYSGHVLFSSSFIGDNITMRYQPERSVHMESILVNMMSNIVLQNFTGGKGSIEVTNQPIQLKYDDEDKMDVIAIVPFLWGFIFFILFVMFMSFFVRYVTEEKASGLKHQMVMAGTPMLLYWVGNFVFDYLIYLCWASVFLLTLLLSGHNYVLLSSSLTILLVVVLILYGISGLFFIYFLSFLFKNPVTCGLMFYLINLVFALFPIIVIPMISGLNISPSITDALLLICSFNPTFAALLCINSIAKDLVLEYSCKESDTDCEETRRSSALIFPSKDKPDGMLQHFLILALSWVCYLTIILIIDWGCFRTMFLILLHRKSKSSSTPEEDEDVSAERETINKLLNNKEGPLDLPLIVENIEKKYLCGPRAVNRVSFLVRPGECFGLLGVNGSGKTTTFKVLTGDVLPDRGNAFMYEYSVLSERETYLKNVGYCPQENAFTNDMTVHETLTFIAKLRGIPRGEVSDEVERWMKVLGIEQHSRKLTGALSGGTKRKLSTSMSLIGDPVVVFLDEPTTGVDPVSKRNLWDLVQARQRAGQSLVMTSHSMEECEALCTRLTILRDGEMKCIGTSEYLKNKFGKGYTVLLKLIDPNEELLTQLKINFRKIFPESIIKDIHTTYINYHILDSIPLSFLFSKLLELKSQHKIIEDFSVRNISLQELFMSFAPQRR
ncbi:hypothetical protein J6590_052894 [Homalodisca vitripennis]|nr:hypothetical protein J6590_052894 [Homalodisca vitripennis]